MVASQEIVIRDGVKAGRRVRCMSRSLPRLTRSVLVPEEREGRYMCKKRRWKVKGGMVTGFKTVGIELPVDSPNQKC